MRLGVIARLVLIASSSSARRVRPYKCPEMPWDATDFRNASRVRVLGGGGSSAHTTAVSGHDRFGSDLFRLGVELVGAMASGAAVHVTQALHVKYAAVLPCLRSTPGFERLEPRAGKYTVANTPPPRLGGAFASFVGAASRSLLQQAFQTSCAFEEGSRADPNDVTIYFSTFEAQATGNFSLGLAVRDFAAIVERNLIEPHTHHLLRAPVVFFDAVLTAHLATNVTAVPRPRVFVVCDPALVRHSTVQYLVEKYGAVVHSALSGQARAPGHLEAWRGFQRDFCFLRAARTVVLSPSLFGWMGTFLSSTVGQVVHFPVLPLGGPLPWCELVVPGDARYIYHDVAQMLRSNHMVAGGGERATAATTFASAQEAQSACVAYARRQQAQPQWASLVQAQAVYRPRSPTDAARLAFAESSSGNATDDAQLAEALRAGGGLYRRPPTANNLPPGWLASLRQTVLVVSCNYAVRDLLLNWACGAERLGLNFVLLPMDAELAAAARGLYAKLFPAVYFSPMPPAGYQGGAIRPDTQSGWRKGQFNEVSYYKLAAVAAILRRGYRVVFSDVDVVFLTDPMPTLFPLNRSALSSPAGVLLPLADFAYQQNEGAWDPTSAKGWGSPRPKEGNSGFYVMASTRATRLFLAAALARCIANPGQDDQANLFNELLYSSLAEGRAVHCVGGESAARPVFGAYAWNASSGLAPSLSSDAAARASSFSACPLPMLPFASGFAHQGEAQGVATWRAALAGYGAQAVLLHFNYLRGHDKKRERIEASGLWVWDDGKVGKFGANSGPEGGTCLLRAQHNLLRH